MVKTTGAWVLIIVLIVWSMTLARSLLVMICGKKLFKKARIGEKTAFIPVINLFSILEISDLSTFMGILFFIPGFNVLVLAIMSYKLGVVFNTSFVFRLGLVCLPIIFYPLLSISDKPYKLSDEEYFRGIENSRTQKLNLMVDEVEKPFVSDQVEGPKEQVDSIFKSDIQMMEKVAPYKAGKIDILGMEKLENFTEEDEILEKNRIEKSKVLTDEDFKTKKSDKDVEMLDL